MIAPYLLRPIIVLGLLALAAGPASTLVNLRRAEFGAETMVHGVFPGIVVGMAVGGREGIIPGGALCAALIAASLTVASRRPRSSEATTAVLLTAFFSLGIVISLRIGDMSGQLESLMFGRLLDITPSRMWTSAAVLVVAAVVLALTWRAQIAVAFDREAARVSGIPVTRIDIAFNAALGAIVVAASTAVGVLLVVGYLIVPGAFGRLLAAGTRSMGVVGCLRPAWRLGGLRRRAGACTPAPVPAGLRGPGRSHLFRARMRAPAAARGSHGSGRGLGGLSGNPDRA